MTAKTMTAAIAVLCLAGPVLAQGPQAPSPDNDHGRYLFEKNADGLVRLDTQTGAVSLCGRKAGGLVCEAAADDRAVLESEIARLQGENGALKKVLLAHGVPLPSGSAPEPPPVAHEQTGSILRMPNRADLDRIVDFADRAWHRLVEAVERAQHQLLNKS